LISLLGFILGVTVLSLKIYLLPLLVFIVTTLCIMGFTFAINNFYDAKSDKINPRRKNINAIASGRIFKKTALVFLVLLAIIPLIISILFRWDVFLFCAYLLFLGWAYSTPPLRTKNIPVIDVLWHFLGFFSYVIWGGLVAGSIGFVTYLMALSIGIFSSIGQVGNHISDYASDKETGTVTFAVWSGLDKAKKTIILLTFIHLVVLLFLFLFYSVKYYASVIFVIVIAILGLVILRPKRGTFPSKNCWTFYFTIVIGGGVYISILIYHLCILLNIPSLTFGF
jgi:4-hydroxybenzoate polyprenyltransferase